MPADQFRESGLRTLQMSGYNMIDEQHVKLSSGHSMPLLGWGCSGAKDGDATQAVKAAIRAGFRVRNTLAVTTFGSVHKQASR